MDTFECGVFNNTLDDFRWGVPVGLRAAPLEFAVDEMTAFAEVAGRLEGTPFKVAVFGEFGVGWEGFPFVYLFIGHI